jgi:hypothetical protein
MSIHSTRLFKALHQKSILQMNEQQSQGGSWLLVSFISYSSNESYLWYCDLKIIRKERQEAYCRDEIFSFEWRVAQAELICLSCSRNIVYKKRPFNLKGLGSWCVPVFCSVLSTWKQQGTRIPFKISLDNLCHAVSSLVTISTSILNANALAQSFVHTFFTKTIKPFKS